MNDIIHTECPDCYGDGVLHDADIRCPHCYGTGKIGGVAPAHIEIGSEGFEGNPNEGVSPYCNIWAANESAHIGQIETGDLDIADASATAQRIVAAYNATAGIALHELESDAVADLIEAARGILMSPCLPVPEVQQRRWRLKNALDRLEPTE